ncbi:MAG TPA: Trp biosynthesis-associated membrane protein [Galbitalea sp.]
MTSSNTELPATPSVNPRARKLRLYTILVIGLLAILTLVTTTQTWWTLRLATTSIEVAGTVAGPALTALSLCGLALAAALSIAGPVFRLILGLLQLLLAFTVVLTTSVSIAHPADQAQTLISKATGVGGQSADAALVKSVDMTAWPWIAIVLGVFSFLAGVWLLMSFRYWPVASRKYQAVRFQPADGPRDAVIDWDALSEGTDPTDPGAPDAGPSADVRPNE